MKKTFSIIKCDIKKELHVGQRVVCSYYGEYSTDLNIIQNILCIFFGYFTPVKFGIIIGDAGNRNYFLTGRKEQFIWVKFKEYFLKKAIPISCIEDAVESAVNLEKFLISRKKEIGNPGYSRSSFDALSELVNKSNKFTA